MKNLHRSRQFIGPFFSDGLLHENILCHFKQLMYISENILNSTSVGVWVAVIEGLGNYEQIYKVGKSCWRRDWQVRRQWRHFDAIWGEKVFLSRIRHYFELDLHIWVDQLYRISTYIAQFVRLYSDCFSCKCRIYWMRVKMAGNSLHDLAWHMCTK